MSDGLFLVFDRIERFGVPLAIAAWLTVFLGVIGMCFALRGRLTTRRALAASAVGGLALAAHMADYFVTLRISPDLALEANPIWRIVVDAWGLPVALAYGFTGKFLLSILSGQMFALYLSLREPLLPREDGNFLHFMRRFGRESPRRYGISPASVALFAFMFALLGPYFFYIAMLNSIGFQNEELWERLPSLPASAAIYLGGILAAWYLEGWRAFRARRR